MRSYKGITPAVIPDHHTRRELETMNRALFEVHAAIRRLDRGTQSDGTGTGLAARSAETAKVAAQATSSQGAEGPAAVVSSTYEATGLTTALPDTELLPAPEPGLYRLNVYLVVTTSGTGTLDLKGYWDDGTSPGAYFILGSVPATAGEHLQFSVPLKDAIGSLLINTICSGTYPTYNIYAKVETL